MSLSSPDVNKKYDVKAILFRDGEKGRTSHKSINLKSFIEVLQSDVVKNRLRDGKLLGLLTHEGRKKARKGSEITQTDSALKDEDLANILRKVTVKDGVVYGYFDLTDTPAARRFKSLVKQGCKIDVSISTELVEGANEFFIKDFHGVDFTMRPEFNSEVVEVNFSESGNIPVNSNPDFRFSKEQDFSENIILGDETSKVEEKEEGTSDGDFSVKEYLRERTRVPSLVLKTRITEVIRYLRMARSKDVQSNKVFLRRYILEYVNEWIMLSLSNPKDDLNIALGLRLSQYCNNRVEMRNLQRNLKRARAQINQNGSMNKDIQVQINKSFNAVMSDIYDYINSKVKNPDKAL